MLIQQRFVRFSLIIILTISYCRQINCCSEVERLTVQTEYGPLERTLYKDGAERYITYAGATERTLIATRDASGAICAYAMGGDGGIIIISEDNFSHLKKDFEEALKK